MRRIAAAFLLSITALSAQIQPGQVDPKRAGREDLTADMPEKSTFSNTVTYVVAPTTVLDKNGNYVNGLQPQDFTLYDKGIPQKITAEVSFAPISMVIIVQRTANVEEILPKIQKDGLLLATNVVGQTGEAAVLGFDNEIRLYQDFTNDPAKIEVAMKEIRPRGYNNRMIDAVEEGVKMLRTRSQKDGRKVILVISEKRDKSSEARLREVLRNAQFSNISIYSINISSIIAGLTAPVKYPRPAPIPTTSEHVPNGGVQTPTETDRLFGPSNGNYVPAAIDIFRTAKSLVVDDTLDAFTRNTGGKEYAFVTNRDLEKVSTALGEELHSQYMLSYSPSNKAEAGYHDIRVVLNRPSLEIRTRPGYWSGPLAE